MPAGLERGLDGGARRTLVAADQFDEDIDVGLGGKLDRIVEPFVPRQDRCRDRASGRAPKRQ